MFFNNTNIEYICKNVASYEPCIQQHPMLIREMEEEIRSNVLPDINNCLDSMKYSIEKIESLASGS